MRKFQLLFTAAAGALFLLGCKTIKPYEKEYLLSPLMDDGPVARLAPKYAYSLLGDFEKLAAGSSGGAASTSCPTCGG